MLLVAAPILYLGQREPLFTTIIKGEIARYMQGMTEEQMLAWVDEVVLPQVSNQQLARLITHLQHHWEQRQVQNRKNWEALLRI